MKIKDLEIKNFRSLLNVSFKELGNFIILIGENSSGKTNIVEILNLFFNDFSVTGGTTSPALKAHVSWYGKRPRKPIEVTMTIQLDEEECKGIFEIDELLKIVKEKYGEDCKKISVCRQVVKPGTPWVTKYLKLGGLDLVKDDNLLSLGQVNRSLAPPTKKPVGIIKAYFFHAPAKKPDFTKDRLIVLGKSAYLMNDFIDSLVRDNKVSYEIVSKISYQAWLEREKLTFTERSPTRDEIDPYLPPEAIPTITENTLKKIVANISTTIKRFKLISANRNVKATLGTREPLIDKTEIIDPFCRLPTLDDPDEEQKLSKLKDKIRMFVPHDLELIPGKMLVWERDLRIPIACIGGGQQEIIGLMWQIYSIQEGSICAVEEPEIHLHAKLSRQLFNLLKKDSGKTQTWLVTHSFIFVDQVDLKNNWRIWKKGKQTMVKRVKSEKELKEILDAMGARPSDRLFPNKVFLACKTEREFISNLAKNMGYKLDSVMTLLAGDLDKHKVEITGGFVKDTQAPLILVVDKHGRDVAEHAKAKKWVEEDNCFILEDTIEDYYPKDLLVKTLKGLFGVTVEEKDLQKPTVKAIQRIKGVPKRWKIPVAIEVAEQWAKKPKTVHLDIMKIIQKLV